MTTSPIELNTAPVNSLVRPSVRDAFDLWAADRNMTRSAAVKHVIMATLRDAGWDVDAAPVIPPEALTTAPLTAEPEAETSQDHLHVFRGHRDHDDARGDVLVWRCPCGAERVHGIVPTDVTDR